MKKLLLALAAAVLFVNYASAQTDYVYTEATDLNLIGKLFDNTPNPYHRVDTVKYKGFTEGEKNQVISSAGEAVIFRTDSKSIKIYSEFGYAAESDHTMGQALRGYDLYIMQDGKWLYAASKGGQDKKEVTIISNMDGTMHECLLYLPMYSEMYSVKIGVEKGSVIEAIESPFRHRVGIFGSSYTQGISISRSGMSYPMQFTRMTGIQLLSLGCSGNCKMQPYFADVLKDADVEALLFDAFSNPGAEMIQERLFPFIESVQEAHPDIPLIFMQTIYRESRNFNTSSEKSEAAKQEMAAKLMKEACKKYDNVYFIKTNATTPNRESSVDGTHPDDFGYYVWARSIEKPVKRILKKYGIR